MCKISGGLPEKDQVPKKGLPGLLITLQKLSRSGHGVSNLHGGVPVIGIVGYLI